MLIIINDDPVYISWLSRHRSGFVLDAKRKPTRNHVILHRAICSVIKPHKRARLTTGGHLKACSLDATELESWAEEQTGGGLTDCQQCHPRELEHADDERAPAHALTRLGREVLSYVLDLAVMYLDGEDTRYRPNVDNVAAYLGKSVAQTNPVMQRLIDEGYLKSGGLSTKGAASTTVIYPTAKALRTIPAFAEMTEKEVAEELDKLKGAP